MLLRSMKLVSFFNNVGKSFGEAGSEDLKNFWKIAGKF